MSSPSTTNLRLHFVEGSPVKGLAVAERRVAHPQACVICVHGALDRGGSFARVVRRLENFDVVAYDRRGYQGSRDLDPVDLDHHLDDLSTLVARESARQPVILLGHSFGGVVTFGVALRDPELVRLVVNFESPMPWILRRQTSRPPLSDDTRAEAERFFRRVVSDKAWERLSEQQRESRRLDGPALASDLAAIQQSSPPYDLARLRVPAVYAYGDDQGSQTDYYRELGVAISKVNPIIDIVEIPHTSHAAHLKSPGQLAGVVQHRWDQLCASP